MTLTDFENKLRKKLKDLELSTLDALILSTMGFNLVYRIFIRFLADTFQISDHETIIKKIREVAEKYEHDIPSTQVALILIRCLQLSEVNYEEGKE